MSTKTATPRSFGGRTIALPVVPGEDGLGAYLSRIRKFPVLDRDEEYMLAQRWREHGDVDAAHKLVTSHLRLVAKIAFGYRGYGLPVSDLISEGNVGLMKAVKKFEPEKGFRLSTYAMWWIKASVTEYILQSWSMVKLGTIAAQKKLFFSMRRIKENLGIIDDAALSADQVSDLSRDLGVSEDEVANMDRRLMARDMSLNARLPSDDGMEYQDMLADDAPNPETLTADRQIEQQRMSLLERGLSLLPERERHILTERRLKDDPVKLEDLGQHYGISRERVRQLEVRAFDKLRRFMTQEAEAVPA